MSQLSIPPVAIPLGRPALLRGLDQLGLALRAWHARWVEERMLVARERALRHLDPRVLKDLGLPETDRAEGSIWRDLGPTRW